MVPEIRLLGPFELILDAQSLDNFPTDKGQAMFAYLALEPGKPIRRESLSALLWPDWPEDLARRHLRQAYYLVKQAVEAYAPGLMETLFDAGRKTIEFRRDSALVDVSVLQAAMNPAASIEEKMHAADLYRGDLLAGFVLPDAPTFDDWLRAARADLRLSVMRLLEELSGIYFDRGDPDEALRFATRQIALDPLHEQAYRQSMRALAAAGNRSEGLALYDELCTRLESELGVGPDRATLALAEEIREGEITLAVSAPKTWSLGPAGSRPVMHNFPEMHTPFFGRDQELEAVHGGLADPGVRLISITGPGGQGKTRLSIEAARRESERFVFPDGIYFIPLASVDRLELIIPLIARQMGLAAVQGEALSDQFMDFIAGKQALLVLDNLEHLAGETQIFRAMLDAAPRLKLLATTREPLNLLGEMRLPLAGLPGDRSAAAALFESCARRLRPDFNPGPEDQAAIERIVGLVDGSPLAIEIAAAWVRVYDCRAIAEEISRSLDFLVSPFRDVPDRHRSMRAVFEHSWQLLTEGERRTLMRLAVFRGDFSAESARAVADAAAFDLASLLDKSLIQRNSRGRFGLHELLRQFLAERESAEDPADSVLTRFSSHFLSFAAARAPDLKTGRQRQALEEIALELENIRAAWTLALSRRDASAIAGSYSGLFHFFDTRSRFVEGELLFSEALPVVEEVPQARSLAAALKARLGWFAFHLGQVERSLDLLTESLPPLDHADRIFSLNYRAAVYRHLGEFGQARSLLAESLELAHEEGDRLGESIALNILGQIASLEGDFELAEERCRQALALKREIGDEWGMTFSLGYLGRVALQVGQYQEALALFEESRALSSEFGDRRGIAFALENLGQAALEGGDQEAARIYLDESTQIYAEIGARRDADRVREKVRSVNSL